MFFEHLIQKLQKGVVIFLTLFIEDLNAQNNSRNNINFFIF
jgi:hypothetical protein